MNVFQQPHFQDEDEARKMLEGMRWKAGKFCPHCGGTTFYATKREGRYRCSAKECRKDFTVTTGTVMEASHIKLTKWLMGFYLMCASKKGVSAHQLHRSLGIQYKSAWFMAHRIRLAMSAGGLTSKMGGEGSVVEADETYYGKTDEPVVSPHRHGRPYLSKGGRGPRNKRPVVALVERGGSVRTFHVGSANKAAVQKIVTDNVDPATRLQTDESKLYVGMNEKMAAHQTVKHTADEFTRWENGQMITTNTIEGFFGIFKNGMRGVYQHCGEKHLHRYLSEYEFRYNHRVKVGYSDLDRTVAAVMGAEGKRLTYRKPDSASLLG